MRRPLKMLMETIRALLGNSAYRMRERKRKGWPETRFVIASIPRCGSTLLVRSLAGVEPSEYFPSIPECIGVNDLSSIPRVRFIKTHALAPNSLPSDVKTIFIFGDPVHSVTSTLQKRWDRNHFQRCGWFNVDEPDIINRDDLGYERMFDSWMKPHQYPVLAVRYEAMHRHESTIAHFLGIQFNLPPWRERTTEVPDALRKKLEITYSSLIEKVNAQHEIKELAVEDS